MTSPPPQQSQPGSNRVDEGTPIEEPSLRARSAAGILWLTLQKWVVRVTSIVSIAVLTRVLSPEDFGIVAAASTVLPFFLVIADLGFSAYIVQVERADQRTLSTAFWYAAGAGLVLCGTLFSVAPLFAAVFRDEELIGVIQVLSLTVLFTAAASVPLALLRRRMRFAAIAGQGVVAALLAQATAIAMALSGLGVWALVGQTLVGAVAGAVLACISARWIPSLRFSWHEFVTMVKFGSNVLGVELVAVARAWAEAAIISSVLGMAALGYMNIAQRLVQIAQELTGGALVPVASVTFARLRDSRGRLQNAYDRALRFTYATLSLPMAFVAVAAPLLVPLLFGDQWSESFTPTQLLAVAATLTVSAALDHGLFYGLGRPGRWFAFALVIDGLTVAVTAVTVHAGLNAIAVGFLGVAVVGTVVRWFIVPRLLGTSSAALIKPFAILVVGLVVTGGVGYGVLRLTAPLAPLISIALIGIAMLSTQLVVVRLIARPVLAEVASLLTHSRAWKTLDRFGRSGKAVQ